MTERDPHGFLRIIPPPAEFHDWHGGRVKGTRRKHSDAVATLAALAVFVGAFTGAVHYPASALASETRPLIAEIGEAAHQLADHSTAFSAEYIRRASAALANMHIASEIEYSPRLQLAQATAAETADSFTSYVGSLWRQLFGAFSQIVATPEYVRTPGVTEPAMGSSTTTPTRAVTATQPAPVQQTIINQQVVERIVSAPVVSGVSQSSLTTQLALLRDDLLFRIASSLTGTAPSAQTNFQAFASSQRIDQLSGTSLTNVTVSGVSGLTDADIPDGITAANYLPLIGGTLTGNLTLSGVLSAGSLLVSTISSGGAIEAPYFTATSTTASSTFPNLNATNSTTTNATSTNQYATALVAGNATSTNFFSTLGRFTTGIFDTLLTAASASITNLTATNATTTRLDALEYVAVGGSATTTIRGDGVASTIPYASSTAVTVSGTASTSNLIASTGFTFKTVTGFLKASAGVVSEALVDLAANVTGILPAANGGTGLTTFGGTNHVLYTSGTDALTSEAAFTYDGSANRLTFDYASTTALTVSGTASTTNLVVSSAGGAAGCATFSTSGLISNTGTACGSGSGTFSWTPTTNFGAAANSTSTPIWFVNGLQASSTSRLANAALDASGYLNFGATSGTSGYGFRDNSGTLEFKNSGGIWNSVNTATTGPSFSVHKNGTNQTVTANTDTLLTWSTEAFDTNNNFDLSTERFTPTVAGKYLVTVAVHCSGSLNARCYSYIYKNGSIYAMLNTTPGSADDGGSHIAAIVDMNGTTDYLEAHVLDGGTSINGATYLTYFSGALIAPVYAGAGGGWTNDGTSSYLIDNADFVGIGTTTPWGRLSINPLATDGTAPSFVIGSSTATNFIVTNGGNVGIGTTTPFGRLAVKQSSNNQTSGGGLVLARSDSTEFSQLLTGGDNNFYTFAPVGGGQIFYVNGSSGLEAMRLTSTGNVGIGATSPGNKLQVSGSASDFIARIDNTANSTSGHGLAIYAGSNSAGGAIFAYFLRPDGSGIGSIVQNGTSGVTYNTTSDRRLKENIDYTKLGLDTLMQLPVREFSFAADETHATITGFIAQELYEVFPFAVSTNGDNGIDPLTGSSTPWSVDYGRITPLLTKAIQDIASIGDTFKANLIAWLADAGNGIATIFADTLFAKRVQTAQLCAEKSDGTTFCVTGDQLANVLLGGSIHPSEPVSSADPGTSTPPTIMIAGENPATTQIGDTYNDLGAIAKDSEGHDLSYRTFINGVLSGDILIDTSAEATDTVDYVATDTWGNTATSTRTVIVDAVAATVVATDANTSTSTSSATSSPSAQ